MVVGAFPVAKLAVLLVKQISKPIANACKERAKNHPFFRTYVCMPPAQFYNWCEIKTKMWILNLGKPVNIPVLSEQMAIELGANLLGEGIIFVLGAGLLIIEYNRQSAKEAVKEQQKKEEMDHIMSTLQDLNLTLHQQEVKLKEMERIVLNSTSSYKSKKQPPSAAPPTPPSNVNQHKDPSHVLHNISNPSHAAVQHNEYMDIETPYPDRGVVMKSLNYIQLDVLSSPLAKSERVDNDEQGNKQRDGVILWALQEIENNMHSLF